MEPYIDDMKLTDYDFFIDFQVKDKKEVQNLFKANLE